jgi:hypothetical protein
VKSKQKTVFVWIADQKYSKQAKSRKNKQKKIGKSKLEKKTINQ